MNAVAAILLAAGRSRRMGAFKPLLPFGDKTVIETCVENLRAAGVGEIVVVVGHRADEVRARLRHSGVEFALNDAAESEMGVSIARGVEEISDGIETFLVALGDQPAIPPGVIRHLLAERKRVGGQLVAPQWQNRGGHPVLIGSEYRDELLHLDPQRGLRALFESHREDVRRVSVDSPYVVRDMDVWEDYCALHEEVFGVPPSVAAPANQS
ncbi:MAG TPA: nucleotidyltransferase family protein [Pyrinomonadaceae bacterium]|jgi:molybdenum cofactor cytidylyltransferase|nr:nucleotidyltransferase family protein [Pyrinomonadaceae bacterium]